MEIVKEFLQHNDIKTTEIGYSRISPKAIAPVGIKCEIVTFTGFNADENHARNPAFIQVVAEAFTR